MTTENREHWGSRLGFILAAAGSAIGLGTMWKLPYVMGQNGGGAFILLFLAFNFLIGIPLFIGELLLGRKGQRGVVGSISRFSGDFSSWNLLGWLCVIAAFLILGWYCVIAGWGFNYLLMELVDAFNGRSVEEIGASFDLFRKSGDLNVMWQILFLAATGGIVYRGLSQGIEYWSRIMTSTLFVVLVILSIYSSTLDGFAKAMRYVLVPDFSLLSANSVLEALGLALFTLSLGYGVMITYGSYMRPSDDIPKTSIIVGFANLLVSILIALMIFPMIFTFGFAPEAGEGLIFKTLPYVFQQLPGSMLISVLFFTLLIFCALTSSVSMLEVAVANFIDLQKWSRKKSVIVGCAVAFIIGLPTALGGTDLMFPTWTRIFGENFLDTNYIVINWLLAIVALLTAVFVGWYLPKDLVQEGFTTGSSLKWLYKPWLISIRFIVPAAVLLIILSRAGIGI